MATVFEMLDDALAGSQLDVQITEEAGNLTGVVNTVIGLISDPPDDFGDFVQQLAETPLPNLEVSGSLATNLGGIRDALPSDLGDITGSLDTVLSNLESTTGLGLTNVLEQVLETLQALQRLLTTDLTCGLTPSGVRAAGAEAGSGEGLAAGGTTAAAAPAADAQAVQQEIDRTISALDALPSPLNVDSLLAWLHGTFEIPHPASLSLRAIPVIETLRDHLDSLLAWKGMSAAEIVAHFVASLEATETFVRQSKEAVLDTPLTDLTALAAQFQPGQLALIAGELTSRLRELRTAIEGGDLSGTGGAVTAIHAALDQYDTLLGSDFETARLEPLRALVLRLEQLPFELEDQMNHIVSVLQPSAALGDWASLRAGPEPAPAGGDAAFAELESFLDTYLAFFTHLVDAIDVSALEGPLSTTADGVRAAVNALDQALVGVTLELQERFADVEGLLDQLDTAAMIAEVQAAIDQFKDSLIQQLSEAFAPVREVIHEVVTQIDQSVDQFDPAAIVEPIKNAIGAIAGVFLVGEAALATIRAKLAEVTELVQDLSFTPVVDEVVAAIEDLSAALKAIDTSLLPTPLKLALSAALAALPQDITPVTDPIIDGFGEMVEAGPVPLVEVVMDQPQRLLDRVVAFDPGALVGDALSEPFQELLTGMESFRPSRLLDTVSAELDTFKDRLREHANPALALEPLVPLYDQLLQGLDALKPGDLVQPVADRLNEVINSIIDTLPVDEVFEQFDAVTGTVEDFLGIGERVVALVGRVRDLFAGFTDSRQQLQTWLDAILSKVDALSDTSPLDAPLTALTGTLESTRAAALQGTFDGSADALLAQLDAPAPETLLADLAQAYHRIPRQELEALAASPQKTAVVAALDRFNPTQAAFSAPYRALADLRAALSEAKANLAAVLAQWDTRYHDDDGVVACYRHTEATAAQLRQWLEEALENQLVIPLAAVFELFELGGRLAAAFLTPLQTVLAQLQGKLDDLLLGPDSLTGIRDALQELIQRLRDFNLDFITDTVDELFATVRGKLEALSPANLQSALGAAFEEMLQTLDLSLAISPESMAGIDAAYDDVVAKLRDLDPQKLVTDVVQPLYDKTVLPLVAALDLTPLLTALVAKLNGLDDELRAEMQRVNTAYQELLRSAPDVSLDIGIDVDIDVDVPF